MPEPVLWFVAFIPRRAMRDGAWWSHWLHPGFQHVMACRALDLDATLTVNHTGTHLVVEVEPRGIGPVLRELQEHAGAWVLALDRPGTPRGPALRGPMTCVEAVKAALGLRDPWTITPRQLAHRMRRLGATPVLPAIPTPQETAPMGGVFSTKAPSVAPTAAQQAAQAEQSAAIRAQEEQAAAQARSDAAARRARGGTGTGRALLLDDELGVTGGSTLTKTLGG